MDRALALEKAREVLNTEIAGIEQVRDSLGDSFLKLVEKNTVFESADHEKAWLIRVCINLCKDSLKSSWKKKRRTIDFPCKGG